jgi:predicted lactoylglutathione lyase
MAHLLFVNLPVKDLDRSIRFFSELGFTFNPQFTDDNATCMIVSDQAFVMLLVEPFFSGFTPKPIANAAATTEVLVTISVDSREAVDEMVNRAVLRGAVVHKSPEDQGFMYGWGFQDLDGHLWEVMWMDPAHVES